MALVLIVDLLVYKNQYHTALITEAVWFLEIRLHNCPMFCVLSKLLLLTLGSLQLDIHFKITCQFIDRRLWGSCLGMVNLQVNLGKQFSFTIRNLPICEHGLFLRLRMSSLILLFYSLETSCLLKPAHV